MTFFNTLAFKNLLIEVSTDSKVGLKKLFVSCHPTMGLRVGSVGPDFYLFWWRSVSFSGPSHFLIETWSSEKEPLSATTIMIVSDKVLLNQCNEGIRFNKKTSNTRGIILICLCDIYPYYVCILFTWKSKCSGGCYFYVITIYFYYFHRFS